MNPRIAFTFLLLLVAISAFSQLESKRAPNGKLGFTNENGEWAIQPLYDELTEFYDSPYAFVKLKGK